jgi:hypothetical protein
MSIDWSMVGAIAGIIAVLLVVIIEADRLFPRLAAIGGLLENLLLAIYVGSLFFFVFGGILFALVSLFVDFPSLPSSPVGRIVTVIVLGAMAVGSITAGLTLLLRGGNLRWIGRYSGWQRFLFGLLTLVAGVFMLYLLLVGDPYMD